ncbi:hypothetical protein ACFU5Y_32420 [Streptomyces gardneri]|uniref:VMAP-C domain-containing protein n=1 Tax=Streptomyces gardneri TaxID=66892 RepID=UPI00368F33B8
MTGGPLFSESHVAHPPALEHALVDQMCAVTGLDTPDGRDLLISMLAGPLPELGNVRRHGRTRLDTLEIVRACLREPRGLPELLATLDVYAPGSAPVLRIKELVTAPSVLSALPEAELRDVRALLARVDHLDAHGELYAAAGDLPLPHRPVATLGEAFDFLSRANARPDGLLPTMVLVEHVAAALDRSPAHRPTAVGLREWNDVQAAKLGLAAPLAAMRAESDRGPAAQPAPACLVVQLCKHGMSPDRYLLSHWRQIRPGPWRPERGEDRVVTLAEVGPMVERLVYRAENDWAGRPGSPVLEFVLPFHLLNEPMEWLPLGSRSSFASALCLSYPVVLRSLERMRAPQFHRRWHNRWQQMQDSHETVCHWDTAGRRGHDPVQWNSRLTADERLVAVALNDPPLQGPGGSRDSLETALRSGVPMAVWDRRPGAPADFRKRAAKKLMKGKPAELPQRVQQLRNEAATAAAAQRDVHVGRHVAVLFDDPNRIVDWSGSPGADTGNARGGHDDEGET